MKRVLYFHQYFKTPEEGGALRSYHIAKGMVQSGMHVDMITTYNFSKYQIENIAGIAVHYLPVYYSNNLSFYPRMYSFLKYVFKSIRLTKKLERPDLIYASSTPLTVGLIALYCKWKRNISYLFEVRDLWPEAPIQLKILKSKLMIFLLRRLEKLIYEKADTIIALSPGIQEGISKCYSHPNTHLVSNFADTSFYHDLRLERVEADGIVLGYFGAFGRSNNLEFILQLAEVCQEKKENVTFILAGVGSEKERILSLKSEWNLENVFIYDYLNRNEIREMLNKVDGCITSFANVDILQINSPNKFFDGLAAGKLSIVNTKGWLKELVEDNNCGFYIDPESPMEFIDKIRPFLENRALLQSYQQSALRLAKRKFCKDLLVKKICDLVIEGDIA